MTRANFGKKEINLISYKEASVFLGLSVRVLSELISNELVPFKKEGQVIYFDKEVLQKWKEKNSEKELAEKPKQDLESLIFCTVLKATSLNRMSERPANNIPEPSKQLIHG